MSSTSFSSLEWTGEWKISQDPVSYPESLAFMEERVKAVQRAEAPELVWSLEHPPLYTAGTSAHARDLLDPKGFPVYVTGRGGQYTYHGPGQRVIYLVLDLKRRKQDVKAYIQALQLWIIMSLKELGVEAYVNDKLVGVWVGEEKIAAIGVRLSRWVTSHGIALNIHPCLSHFAGIVPCGLKDRGITSLEKLGVTHSLYQIDRVLELQFGKVPFLAFNKETPP